MKGRKVGQKVEALRCHKCGRIPDRHEFKNDEVAVSCEKCRITLSLIRWNRYQKMLAALAIAFLLAGCASFERQPDWSRGQKIAEGSWQVLNVVDGIQTAQIAKHPDEYRELNFLYGSHPSTGRVVAMKAGAAIIHPLVTHYLPFEWRKYWLGVTIGVTGGCVVSNFVTMDF